MKYKLSRVEEVSGLYLKVYPDTGAEKYVVRKTVDGKRQWISLGSKEDWKSRWRDLKNEVKKLTTGSKPAPKRITFGSIADQLVAIKTPHKKTIAEDRRRFGSHLASFASKNLDKISPAEIATWHNDLATSSGKVEANHCLALMSTVFNYALNLGLINYNPCRLVKRFPEQSRDRYVTAEELPRLVAATRAQGPYWTALFGAILYTGARPGNVMAMRWVDIDLQNGIWVIPHTKNGHAVMVPLIPRLVGLLDALPRISQWVFPANHTGRAEKRIADVPISNLHRRWAIICREANVVGLTVYDLRRTMATYQGSLGVSLHQIAQSLGHLNTRATPIYARSEMESIRHNIEDTVELMVDIAEGRKKK